MVEEDAWVTPGRVRESVQRKLSDKTRRYRRTDRFLYIGMGLVFAWFLVTLFVMGSRPSPTEVHLLHITLVLVGMMTFLMVVALVWIHRMMVRDIGTLREEVRDGMAIAEARVSAILAGQVVLIKAVRGEEEDTTEHVLD